MYGGVHDLYVIKLEIGECSIVAKAATESRITFRGGLLPKPTTSPAAPVVVAKSFAVVVSCVGVFGLFPKIWKSVVVVHWHLPHHVIAHLIKIRKHFVLLFLLRFGRGTAGIGGIVRRGNVLCEKVLVVRTKSG